jgi:hypothetical protein
MSGESFTGLPNGRSPKGGSLDQDPPGGSPLDPLVGFYGWQAPIPRIFMPPWYQLILVRSKPTSRLPYQKLQYPTYVKDIDPNAHIRVFKIVIKSQW